MLKQIILTCFIASVVFGGDVIMSVQDIRNEYGVVNKSIKSYKQSTSELLGLSTEGGQMTLYKDKLDNTRLLKAEINGETYRDVLEYYFKNSTLFFVYSVHYTYNAPIYTEMFDSKKTVKKIDRYYFINSFMVKWLDGKKEIKESDSSFAKGEKMIIDELIQILLKSK